eukprot:gene22017-29076_t
MSRHLCIRHTARLESCSNVRMRASGRPSLFEPLRPTPSVVGGLRLGARRSTSCAGVGLDSLVDLATTLDLLAFTPPPMCFDQGSTFYRIIDRFMDQSGANTESVYGGTFVDDAGGLALKHDRKGLLSMAIIAEQINALAKGKPANTVGLEEQVVIVDCGQLR